MKQATVHAKYLHQLLPGLTSAEMSSSSVWNSALPFEHILHKQDHHQPAVVAAMGPSLTSAGMTLSSLWNSALPLMQQCMQKPHDQQAIYKMFFVFFASPLLG
jgi:hypothetical protein